MSLGVRLKIFRLGVLFGIPASIVLFIWCGGVLLVSISDLILFITALLLVWYAGETLALVELTRIKDQPFLEIAFPNDGAKVILKIFGSMPAYSPTISSIRIGENILDFDPLLQSQLPILPNEARDFWVHHRKGSSSFVDSLPVLRDLILNSSQSSNLKITIRYFDKDGEKLERNLYLKVGGELSQKKYIYASTSPENSA